MKHLKIHKFPFKNVIVLAIECKMYLKIQQKQTKKKLLKCLVLPYLHGVGLRSLNRHFQIECLISHFRPHLYGKKLSHLEGSAA